MGRPPANSLFVIQPYRWSGMWVFDDPAVGLVKEPFVAGVPEMIEHALRDVPGRRDAFVAVFSASPFPGAQVTLERTREEGGGNWYRWTQTGQEGWLCPALFRYFEQAPERLYVQIKPAPEGG
jgi:hypothetical protein